MIDRQEFREDLYYRLNGLAVRLPALRDRTDLEAVAKRLLLAERPHDTPELSAQVLDMFRRYAWPGNIRQMANVLRTAAVMAAGEHQITRAHLSDDFLEDTRRAAATPARVASEPMPYALPPLPDDGGQSRLAPSPPLSSREDSAPEPASPRTLEQAEVEMIRAALDAAGGNISAASKQLGISRNTIYRKLRWNQNGPQG
jgi:transcriptional regulator of acetoin/glycerol metabolism